MERKAFAKINLTLDITGRDARGYHLLSSVFAPVTLADTVTVTPGGVGITLECDAPGIPTDRGNLCVRGAEAFLDKFSLSDRNFRIGLEKAIPACAGLGGGSSDCAAVLRMLAEFFSIPGDDPRLAACVASLGADVPFFLQDRPCLAQGTGEKLTPLSPLPSATVLILRSGDGASTPEIYRKYDADGIAYPENTPEFLAALSAGVSPWPYVGNHLAPASRAFCPAESRLIEALRSNGALAAQVTGSGSAVYGIFSSSEAAKNAQSHIDAEFSHLCVFA